MINLHRELCDILDRQDVNVLHRFLEAHPDLNLNAITPNGLSALWWALAPHGRVASIDMIMYLLQTGKIHLNQHYQKQYAYQYTSSSAIADVLREATMNFLRVDALAKSPLALARFAAQDQNTHDSVLNNTINRSVAHLYRRYGEKESLEWDKRIEECLELPAAKEALGPLYEKARKGIDRLRGEEGSYTYTLSEGLSVTLSNAQVLMLIWAALNDVEANHFVIGTDLSSEEMIKRKLDFFKHLATSNVAISIICWMGLRNHMVTFLDGIHLDVRIAQEVPFSSEMIRQQYAAFCKGALQDLEKNNLPLFTAYLFYYPLRGLAGGCEEEGEIPQELVQWVMGVKENFRKKIHLENEQYIIPNLQLPPAELMTYLAQMDKWIDALIDPSHVFAEHAALSGPGSCSLLHEYFLPIKKLERFFLLQQVGLGKNIRAAWQAPSVIDAITLLVNALCQNALSLEEALLRLEALLIEKTQPGDVENWLSTNTHYNTFIEQLDEPQREDWLKAHAVFVVRSLLQTAEDIQVNPDYLWVSLHKTLTERCVELSRWLDSLPNESRVEFLQMGLDKKWYTCLATDSLQEEIRTEAVAFAFKTRHVTHLTISTMYSIKNKDLRGIDLTTVVLSNVIFSHCDLRLTGIEKNDTFSWQHVSSNRLDEKWIDILIKNDNLNAVMGIITHPDCPVNDIFHRCPVLFPWIARNKYFYYLRTVLNNRYFTLDLLLLRDESQTHTVDVIFRNNWIEGIELLLFHPKTRGLDLVFQGRLLEAPLMFLKQAIQQNCLQIVKCILSYRSLAPDILNTRIDEGGKTVLHLAVRANNLRMMNAILTSSYCSTKTLLVTDTFGRTVLMEATQAEKVEAVEVLLSSRHMLPRMLCMPITKAGETILHWAIRKNHLDISKMVLEKIISADIFNRLTVPTQQSVLQDAISHNRVEIVKLIVSHALFPPARMILDDLYQGEPVLHWAIHGKHVDIIQVILKRSHNKEIFTQKSRWYSVNAIEEAINQDCLGGMLLFLDCFYFPFDEVKKGNWRIGDDILHWAARKGHLAVIQAISKRYDLFNYFSSRDDLRGNNLMSVAVCFHQTKIVECLLLNRFPFDHLMLRNVDGITAIDFVVGKEDIIDLFKHFYYERMPPGFVSMFWSELSPLLGARRLLMQMIPPAYKLSFFKSRGGDWHEVSEIIKDIDENKILNLSQLLERLNGVRSYEKIDPFMAIKRFLADTNAKLTENRMVPAPSIAFREQRHHF